MIKIYVTNSRNISLTELNINKTAPNRRDKIRRLTRDSAKRQSLAAGLLLTEIFPNSEIKTGEYGKPYIENEYFNLAHSGDYVILAVSDSADIGCDIERIKIVDYEKIAKTVFCENEREMLRKADDKQNLFFEFWTKKESFMKCIGEGFHFPPSTLDLTLSSDRVLYGGKIYFFKEYMLSGYKIMLCSEDNAFPENLTELNFE
ncbi:MAG: 4'-phosphopantetheinyl transferase superfamily protein [Ruminococcus sp.]|nr:4'-phosphopantetheinyl transferase superfamily protein [Ruminococcus sp.]